MLLCTANADACLVDVAFSPYPQSPEGVVGPLQTAKSSSSSSNGNGMRSEMLQCTTTCMLCSPAMLCLLLVLKGHGFELLQTVICSSSSSNVITIAVLHNQTLCMLSSYHWLSICAPRASCGLLWLAAKAGTRAIQMLRCTTETLACFVHVPCSIINLCLSCNSLLQDIIWLLGCCRGQKQQQ